MGLFPLTFLGLINPVGVRLLTRLCDSVRNTRTVCMFILDTNGVIVFLDSVVVKRGGGEGGKYVYFV